MAQEVLTQLRQKLKGLGQREADVRQKEKVLADRETTLAEVERRLLGRIEELRKLSAGLQNRPAAPESAPAPAAVVDHGTDDAERVQRVSALLSGMSPKKAASLFAAMRDDELAGELLKALPQEQAGRVLSQMRPEAAARLTQRLGMRLAKASPVLPKADGKPEAKKGEEP